MELDPARQRELNKVASMIGEFQREHMIIDSELLDGSIERKIINASKGIEVGVAPNGTVNEQTDIKALEDLLDDGIDPTLN